MLVAALCALFFGAVFVVAVAALCGFGFSFGTRVYERMVG